MTACNEGDVEKTPVDHHEPFVCGLDETAFFIGGSAVLFKYIANNLKYPDRMCIEGKVFVAFVVNIDGSVSGVEVIRGLGHAYDEEAMRVVRNSPKWNPGKHSGTPIRQRFVIPIPFRLSQ